MRRSDAMTGVVREGMLVLADISGYTRYLGGVELEHSHDILADLIGAVSDSLSGTMRVVKLEGDAVFCCGESQSLERDLEGCYAAFARRQRTIALNSSCGCDACRQITDLELKFVAHHGSFVEHEVAGSRELVGSDVIVVHRMLKNSVPERLGLRRYAFLSDAAAERGGVEIAGRPRHGEDYADIGHIEGVVLDLEDAWRGDEQARVTDERARIVVRERVPAPPERVWRAQTELSEQLRWRVGVTDMHSDREPGVGAVTHCVHGRMEIAQEILEWDPPRRYTYAERNPMGRCLWTVEVEPAPDGGSTIVWRIALAGGWPQRLLYALAGSRLRSAARANLDSLATHLRSSARETAGHAPGA